MLGAFQELIGQASAQNTRSTILKPLGWLIVILASATLGCYATNKVPSWMAICFFATAMTATLAYLVAYAVCFFKNPELLRSETFIIQKMAIEKSYVGDSSTGLINPASIDLETTKVQVSAFGTKLP